MENQNLKDILLSGSDMQSVYSRQDEEERTKTVVKSSKYIEYDPKNFLSVKIKEEDKISKKTIRCRILDCFDLDDETCVDNNGKPIPFKEVWSHSIRNKEGKFKTYTCLKHTKGIEHLGLGDKCPICELEEMKLLEASKEKDKERSKELWINAKSYSAKKQYIVRVIDRDLEEDGVKFWRFDSSNNKQGVYDKLSDLYLHRLNGGSIYNTYNGKDINIDIVGKVSKVGNKNIFKSSISSITDDEVRTPLSENDETIMSWVKDEKKWYLIFPPKPFGYLDVAMYGDTPKLVSVDVEVNGELKQYKVWSSKNDYDAIKSKGGNPVFDYRVVKLDSDNNPVIEGEWVDNSNEVSSIENDFENEINKMNFSENTLTNSLINEIEQTEDLPF